MQKSGEKTQKQGKFVRIIDINYAKQSQFHKGQERFEWMGGWEDASMRSRINAFAPLETKPPRPLTGFAHVHMYTSTGEGSASVATRLFEKTKPICRG